MRNRIYELHKNMVAVSAACSRKENTQETADDRKNATVTYNFATGDTVTIELEEGTEVAVYITERKRLEENEARRIRYNERHLDTGSDHGDWNSFVDPETDELYQKEKERSDSKESHGFSQCEAERTGDDAVWSGSDHCFRICGKRRRIAACYKQPYEKDQKKIKKVFVKGVIFRHVNLR